MATNTLSDKAIKAAIKEAADGGKVKRLNGGGGLPPAGADVRA